MGVTNEEHGSAGRRSPFAFRDEVLVSGFTLPGHLIKTATVTLLIIGLGLWLARDAKPWVWLTVPVFWVISNFFEWSMHRYPMHKPLRPRMLYTNHAKIHHRAYDGEAREVRHERDLSLVMMPWYTLIIVFFMACPIALVSGLLAGPGVAGAFFVGAVAYFWVYETIHTLHHLPMTTLERLGLAKWRWLAALRRHHHHHHVAKHMTRVNFNVTFPLADWVMGTYEKPPEPTRGG